MEHFGRSAEAPAAKKLRKLVANKQVAASKSRALELSSMTEASEPSSSTTGAMQPQDAPILETSRRTGRVRCKPLPFWANARILTNRTSKAVVVDAGFTDLLSFSATSFAHPRHAREGMPPAGKRDPRVRPSDSVGSQGGGQGMPARKRSREATAGRAGRPARAANPAREDVLRNGLRPGELVGGDVDDDSADDATKAGAGRPGQASKRKRDLAEDKSLSTDGQPPDARPAKQLCRDPAAQPGRAEKQPKQRQQRRPGSGGDGPGAKASGASNQGGAAKSGTKRSGTAAQVAVAQAQMQRVQAAAADPFDFQEGEEAGRAKSADPGAAWEPDQLAAYHEAVNGPNGVPLTDPHYWQKVAQRVRDKSAKQCFALSFDSHPTPPERKPQPKRYAVGPDAPALQPPAMVNAAGRVRKAPVTKLRNGHVLEEEEDEDEEHDYYFSESD
ncbi:hypothetical protein WJX72_007924 [[Myrmecia] bisecta]|uniref:Uncharacterized protein n=1 Tax=[Myrmecia] bisecta TaxID=41462 RepID=A0AAW1QRQ7_9CHLO